MDPFRKILVAVEGDAESRVASGWAGRLARHRGADVTLLGVAHRLPWYERLASPIREVIEDALLQEEREVLDGLALPLREAGLPVVLEARLARPWLEFVREAVRGGHDLLIKDVGPDEHGLFHATDWHLLRTCPCPVLLTRPAREVRPRIRLLALVDPVCGSSPSEREGRAALDAAILELAASLAEWEGCGLAVAHAWDAAGSALLRHHGRDEQQVEAYVEGERGAARDALDRLLVPFRGRIDPGAVHLLRGRPEQVLPRFAEAEGVDLIVMGTVARSGIAGLVIGNTAETILQRVRCSVLAVKPEGFVSPVLPEGMPASGRGEERDR
jgi:nucleotide-binding universal stress UspA family protein